MQNENRVNQTPLSKETGEGKTVEERASQKTPEAQSQNPPEDFLRMKEWVRQAKGDADRSRKEAEKARGEAENLKFELQNQARTARRSGWTSAVLALALIGACVYGYYAFQGQGAMLGQLPIVQKSLDAVGQRVTAAEEKLGTWASNWDGITERIAKVEKSARGNLQLAKNYGQEQAAKVHHQLQAELDNRSQGMEVKLSQLEAGQKEDRARLAELRQDMTNVRGEMSQQIAQAKQETGRNLENLDGQISRNRSDLDELNHQLERRRLDFEVSKEQTREVAPGITLTVSGTNVSYQRVEGRIHVIPDGRILWLRGQGIQQAVVFYSQQDRRPYELVFTRVSKDGAVGYVLTPLWPSTGVPVANNNWEVSSATWMQ